MKKRLTQLTTLVLFFVCISLLLIPNVVYASQDSNVFDFLFGNKSTTENKNETLVYLGGFPLGVVIDSVGVTVVGFNEFINANGKVSCPAQKAGILINDKILAIDEHSITNSTELAKQVQQSNGKELKVSYSRNNQIYETKISPDKDMVNNNFKLGLFTRDNSSGIGTVTFVKENLHFGALGHPICDEKGNLISVNCGSVYSCKIQGVNKGTKGSAGELKGSFNFENKIGSMKTNNKFGIFGEFSELPERASKKIKVAKADQVVPGKAYVFTTLDNVNVECFEIEIIKVNNQQSPDDRSFVLRVTDKELLAKTGGIVQGMSGSPIVQNNKLVGAVTHVFLNDPTKGYGIFAEWMLQN